MRLMPTSITVAPGLTISPVTRRGEPTAATRTSARRQTSARSRVREWQTVTVACAFSEQARERPADQDGAADDHRLGTLDLDARLRQELHHPLRGARHQAGPALGEEAGAGRGEAVDVLGWVDAPR